MRWQDKTKAYWIRVLGISLYEYSQQNQVDLELIAFSNGLATVSLKDSRYSEDLHIKLQDYIEAKHSGVAIFFSE